MQLPSLRALAYNLEKLIGLVYPLFLIFFLGGSAEKME